MLKLSDRIYYVDDKILEIIQNDFIRVDKQGWYELFVNKSDGLFWRLDPYDKYQERFFIKLESKDHWTEYDEKDLVMDLILRKRGISNEECVWKDCEESALNGLAYCVRHAYEEVGVRK